VDDTHSTASVCQNIAASNVKGSHPQMQPTTIGLDVAKHVFKCLALTDRQSCHL